jgi:hypothetical protein
LYENLLYLEKQTHQEIFVQGTATINIYAKKKKLQEEVQDGNR